MVLDYTWNWNFSEIGNLAPKVFFASLYAWGVIDNSKKDNLDMFYR